MTGSTGPNVIKRIGDIEYEILINGELVIRKSELDVAEIPTVVEEYRIKIPNIVLDTNIIMALFQKVLAMKYPLKSQIQTFAMLNEYHDFFKEICDKSVCICPLWWTVGCYELLSVKDIEKLMSGKVVKFFITELSGRYGADSIINMISESWGKYLQMIKGTGMIL